MPMTSYINRILIDGEQVIYRARLSMWSQSALVVTGIVLLPALGLGLLLLGLIAAGDLRDLLLGIGGLGEVVQ